jgi:hypothetical protein
VTRSRNSFSMTYSPEGISVLDLGYLKASRPQVPNCKPVASDALEGGFKDFIVPAILDGMGLTRTFFFETPHLTQIAHLVLDPLRTLESAYYLAK